MALGDWFASQGDALKQWVIDGIMDFLKLTGAFACDIICVGIVTVGVVCAFKIIVQPAHPKDENKGKYSLIEGSSYMCIAYFIARLMNIVLQCV